MSYFSVLYVGESVGSRFILSSGIADYAVFQMENQKGEIGMNESQERREELLRMSRQKWGKGSIPAVHPRYQHVYRGLYGESSSEGNGGSRFFARMFISFLIFAMFTAAD